MYCEALTIAYALHRMVLAGVLGIAPDQVPLARDERGCPWLPGLSLHTSLSHAEGVAAFAVCAMGAVGIDIEPSQRASELPQVFYTVLRPVHHLYRGAILLICTQSSTVSLTPVNGRATPPRPQPAS